jgi:nucleoside-diphosphate-sugar epimerase
MKLGYQVREIVRTRSITHPNQFSIKEIDGQTDWTEALKNVDTIIHCAAYLHDSKSSKAFLATQFATVNYEGTVRLAKQSALAGVRRLIFLSTIKVNGERTFPGKPFIHTDIASPQNSYAISKYKAELALLHLGSSSGLEIVIIRSPLVYGPYVKANFLNLLNLVSKGWYLPVKSIQNKRSFISLGNLVDLVMVCIHHKSAVGQTFLVSDGYDLSTPELIRTLAKTMDLPAKMFSIPPSVLHAMGVVTFKKEAFSRLTSSLQVDITHTCQVLNWRPPESFLKAFSLTIDWYLRDMGTSKNSINQPRHHPDSCPGNRSHSP